MTYHLNAAGLAISLVLLGSGAVLAKAHDMGVADGTRGANGLSTGEFVKSLGGNGVSGGTSKGLRGRAASELKVGNRTVPTHIAPEEPK